VARPPLPFPVPPPAAPQPAAPEQQPAPATGASLRMQFDESAWVQVRDSTGRMLVSGLNPSGTTVEVNGKAPFYLVVGNAVHVRVVYKGQPVDLAPFTSVNVARLTLNQ
jgi:cytoskeleton protein RodZ